MILLDTHVWVWWIHRDERLTATQEKVIRASEAGGIGVSAISVWEVAKLVEHRRIELPCSLEDWFEQALSYPGIRLLELTPAIIVESTRLPGAFHRDPADQIIVATARILDCTLLTSDHKLLSYEHVRTIR